MCPFLLAALLPLLLNTALHAQNCVGSIVLETQQQIDTFACRTVEGDLTVSGANITNVDSLSSLVTIGGDLNVGLFRFGNPSLANVDGLSSVTGVGGALRIVGNDVLTDVDGFSSLAEVGGDLQVGGFRR